MKALTRQFALYKQTILTDTRSLGFQALRFGFAALLAIFFYFNQSVGRPWMKIDGLYIFENLSILNITFIYLASFCLFLPLIKEERDENTLGMILMTGVSPFAYLFGKIGSRVSMLIIMLSIQIPFTYLCITMGGLSTSSILCCFLIFVFTCMQMATLCVFVSLFSTSLLSGMFIASGIYILSNSIFCYFSHIRTPFVSIDAVSLVLGSTGGSYLSSIMPVLIWMLFTSALFFGLSLLIFNKMMQPQKDLELPAKLKRQPSSAVQSETVQKAPFFSRLFLKRFGNRAIATKDFRFTHFGPWFYLLQITFLALLFWANYHHIYYDWGYNSYGQSNTPLFRFAQANLFPLSLAMLLVIIAVSSRMITSEINGNTLSSLLMLPQTPKKLFWQKFRGALISMLPMMTAFSLNMLVYASKNIDDLMAYDEYLQNMYYYQALLISFFMVSSFFLSAAIATLINKYAFFFSAAAITASFFAHIFSFSFFPRSTIGAIFGVSFIIGLFTSFLCYKVTVYKISKAT